MEGEWYEGPSAGGEEPEEAPYRGPEEAPYRGPEEAPYRGPEKHEEETPYHGPEKHEETPYHGSEKDEAAYSPAEADETVYYEAEADETAYYEAEMDETVYYDAEPNESAYYDAECEGPPGDLGAPDEPPGKGEEYDAPPEQAGEFDAPANREEDYDSPSGSGDEAGAPAERAEAPGGSAGHSARPRSFMAQMTSLLLRRRGRRGKASVERYKEARKLKRRAADRAKRSELNKICTELSKAADETEAEAGWSERQKEKIRAWRAEREAKPDWAEQQAAFILEWRQMLTEYALRQYKRAMSKAGLFRPLKQPTFAQQVAALAAYRARQKEEAFLNAEKTRVNKWAQGAWGQPLLEGGMKPNLALAAMNNVFTPVFPPLHVQPEAAEQPQVAWQPHPLTAIRGLLPTPKNIQPKAEVAQDPDPVKPPLMAPQATWNQAPSDAKHEFPNPRNLQPNRRDLPPSSELPPVYPMHMRPHASWHQAPMNVNRGMPPQPWR